jgi:hypothetical protein
MTWIYQTKRISPAGIAATLKGRSQVSNLRGRLTKGNLIVDVGWTLAVRPNCRTRPTAGVCLSGLKTEYYALPPLNIVAQQYYFDSMSQKGYWYEYRFEGSTGATYTAWYAAADAATNSSNVGWINNGKASAAVQIETRDTAASLTRPVLLRRIAQRLQTTRSIRAEEYAQQTKLEDDGAEETPTTIPWLPIAVVGAGVLLFMRR